MAFANGAHGAESCETLRTQIESKIGAAGVTRFTVTVADAHVAVSGQVVGSYELGGRKIVYQREGGPAPDAAPSRSHGDRILTECRDGTVSVGGNCKK